MEDYKFGQDKQSRSFGCYLNAVAINNIGVQLLERRCYAQAAEVLQQACVLMDVSSWGDDSTNIVTVGENGKDYVAKSMESLMNPQPSAAEVMLFEVLTIMPDGALACGDNRQESAVLDSLLQGTPCCDFAFPIRLKINQVLSEVTIEDHDRQTAVLRHNLGIARFGAMKSLVVTTGCLHAQCYRNMLQAALDQAKYASYTLLQQEISSTEEGQSPSFLSQCLALVSLALLIQILQEARLEEPTNECYRLLCELRDSLLDQRYCNEEANPMSLTSIMSSSGASQGGELGIGEQGAHHAAPAA